MSTAESPVPSHKFTTAWKSGTGWNLFGTTMPEMDRLMDAALTEPDAAKRKEIIAKAMHIAVDSYTVVALGTTPRIAAIGPTAEIELPTPMARQTTLYADIVKHRK